MREFEGSSTELTGETRRHLLDREKERLLSEAGLASDPAHFRRVEELPFTADERRTTTILFGNLTPKHEAFIRAAFERSGLRVENLPEPTKKHFRIGKEYCNNGVCNPAYFTAGTLIEYLQKLEDQGLSRARIIADYAYLTLSDCGPCRFGMYESEYRQALENAGFSGFRVLTFQLNKASRTGGKKPGLEFSLDLWLDLVNALMLGDLLYQVTYQIRPYEVQAGDTDRATEDCIQLLKDFLRNRNHFELHEQLPGRVYRSLARRITLRKLLHGLGMFRHHFYDRDYRTILKKCAERLDQVQVDRTRPRPIVKIVGEFYSHLSEGDTNYNMFTFLESEGAEVAVGSVGQVLQYWFYKSRLGGLQQANLDSRWWQPRRRFALLKKPLILTLIDRIYTHQFRRMNEALGGLVHGPVAPEQLARAAAPFYRSLTRGGEGYMEVAKSIHYTRSHSCHMVLSLKPFGCMPSTQSDGVMATVTSHNEDILFASIETTGDGDINALSRAQMVLSDAKRKARSEFERALASTDKQLHDIKAYAAARPELLRPTYSFPHRPGIVSVAANYILHVSDLMNGKGRRWRKRNV